MNKKVVIGIIIIIAIIGIAIAGYMAYSNNNTNNTQNEAIQNDESNEISNPEENLANENETLEQETSNNGKTLIAYFSLPETTGTAEEDSTITINGQKLGNTQYVANLIQEHTKADVFRIEPVKQYNTSNHQELINDAQEEQRQNARPEIKEKINNFDDYDTIFIGYPIWWGIAAWPVDTFVKANNFDGKKVIPFCTSSSSGLGQSGKLLQKEANSGNWQDGHRFSSSPSDSDIQKWIDSLK